MDRVSTAISTPRDRLGFSCPREGTEYLDGLKAQQLLEAAVVRSGAMPTRVDSIHGHRADGLPQLHDEATDRIFQSRVAVEEDRRIHPYSESLVISAAKRWA